MLSIKPAFYRQGSDIIGSSQWITTHEEEHHKNIVCGFEDILSSQTVSVCQLQISVGIGLGRGRQ
jgi:hypothetical protein